MNDDKRDEVPVPHFEDELWPTLARAHTAQRKNATSPTAQPPQLFDVSGRRRGRRVMLAGVGSIAAAAALLTAIVVTDGDDGSETTAGTGTTSTAAPEVELTLAAKITAATQEASANSVVHTVQDQLVGPGDSEMWSDEQSGAFRSLSFDEDGDSIFDSGPAVAPTMDDTGPGQPPEGMPPTDPSWPRTVNRQVDHCFEQYADAEQPAIPGRNEADLVGERLADGSLVADGTEVVDGRELIRLVEVPVSQRAPTPRQGSNDGAAPPTTSPAVTTTVPVTVSVQPPVTVTVPGTQPAVTTTVPSAPVPTTTPVAIAPDDLDYDLVEHIYFVDPETNRPVRLVGYPGSDVEYVMTIEYLPRTPENLAVISPPVPEGFSQVDQLRGDGERADSCGW